MQSGLPTPPPHTMHDMVLIVVQKKSGAVLDALHVTQTMFWKPKQALTDALGHRAVVAEEYEDGAVFDWGRGSMRGRPLAHHKICEQALRYEDACKGPACEGPACEGPACEGPACEGHACGGGKQ